MKLNPVPNRHMLRAIDQGLMMRWRRRPDSGVVELVSEYSLETGRVRTRSLFRTEILEAAEMVTQMIRSRGGQVGNEPAAAFCPPDDWWDSGRQGLDLRRVR